MLRRPLGILTLALLVWPAALPAQDAEAQFRKSCMSCHTIGAGRKVGPDLKDLGKRRPHEWSAKFISSPSLLIDGGDATATALLRENNGVRMPDLGITPPEAEALLKLIDDFSAQGKTLGTAAIVRNATPEDLRRGQRFLTGELRFQAGGPACISCHAAPGVGFLGGGRLGPDLTAATAKFGNGLAGVIENPAFPTMQGVFSRTSLTAEEAFQVAAYLKSVGSQPPARPDYAFPVLGLVGLAAGILLGGHLGRKRLKGVRGNLRPRA